MKLKVILFLLVLSILISSVLADQVKLEIPATGPFNVGDTFHLLVHYNPEGGAVGTVNEKIIGEIAFTVVNPNPASITFQSASSSGPLRTIRSNQKSGDNWAYRESGNDVNYFCEGDLGEGAACVGNLNQFNSILDITARVEAVPAGSLTFTLQGLEGLNLDVQNVNPTAVYAPDPATITFAGADGDVCDVNHRDLCITQDTCLAVAGSVWYDDNDAGTANCLVACRAGTEDSDNDRVCTAVVQECVPNTSQCVGQTSRRVCQAGGTWPAEAEICSPGQTCQNGQCQGAVCGNSVIDAGETCDDGNQVNDDGCSSVCVTEVQPAPGGTPPAPKALAGDLSGNGCYDSADIYEAGNTPTRGFIAFIQGLLGNNNNINSLNTFIWGMFNQWGQGCS